MPGASLPKNELKRLSSLKSYEILDTLREKEYDDIVKLASFISGAPISVISLVDQDRQWFKSKTGLDVDETPRELAFCAHAILKPEEPLIVPDATKDERFSDNALVTGQPDIRFYTGCPLNTSDGYSLGTLCVIDTAPKELTSDQIEALQVLSRSVVSLLELRKANSERQELIEKLKGSNEELECFAFAASHDLNQPLRSMRNYASFLEQDYSASFDDEGRKYLRYISSAAERGFTLVEDLLEFSRVGSESTEEVFDANQVMDTVLLNIQEMVSLSQARVTNDELPKITGSPIRFLRLLQNLITNSIKYQKKGDIPIVHVGVEEHSSEYLFSVKDNGIGIDSEYIESIFEPFKRLHTQKKYSGTGLGLSICRKIAQSMNGRLWVDSEPGVGSVFYFSVPKVELVEEAV